MGVEQIDQSISRMAQIMDAIANNKYGIPTGQENVQR
jgi:hypothetical protein